MYQEKLNWDEYVAAKRGYSPKAVRDKANSPWEDPLDPKTWLDKDLKPGTKYDSGKVPLDLLDPAALEGLAAVLQFGAKKYQAHNWRGGISYSRLLGAMMRHLFAILRGEDVDPESGLPHVDHLGCCWMFLSNMMKTRQDLDDRYKKTETKYA